ncbi:MAG: LysR family transcriptional regulator [Neomegalonema sp.]|nr:LysR family transcriptional regulator [Neomegalonema sp.]
MSATTDRIELLETFVRIAETGSFTEAARQLETTQPTVSRRVQQLEALLSAKLVDRSTQGLSLTSAGAGLLPEAREVIGRWRGLSEMANDENGEVVGLVRLAVSSDLSSRLLPTLLAHFLSEFPDVRLDIKQYDGPLDLGADGTDFALRIGKQSRDNGVVREIGMMRRILVCAPSLNDKLQHFYGAPLPRCEPLTLEGAPLITHNGHYSGPVKFTDRNGEVEEIRFDRVVSFDDMTPVFEMTLAGAGLAILPDWLVRDSLAMGTLIHVCEDWVAEEQPISLVWQPDRLRSTAATTLMEAVQDGIAALLE